MVLHKMPIAWHEEGLKNSKIFLEQESLILRRQQEKVDNLRYSIKTREKMIAYAKSKNMDSFDENSKLFKRIIEKEMKIDDR